MAPVRRAWISIPLALLFAGCRSPASRTGALRLCVGPSETGSDPRTPLQALTAALGRHGLPAEGAAFERPVDVVRALGENRCDAALANVFAYLFARSEYGARAVLRVRRDGSSSYGSALLVREGAEVRSVADLQGRVVAFAHPHSLSGFFLPARLLREAGVKMRDPLFAGSHAAALAALLAGRADAAAVFHHPGPGAGGRTPLAESPEARGRVRVLAVTESVPYEPVFVRRDLPRATRERLAWAFSALAGAPEGRAALHRLAQIEGFEPVRDEDYAPVARTLRAAGKAVEDLVPGAWRLSVRNRPSFDFWP
jgi:phosphonate transport system substrate-binding protein